MIYSNHICFGNERLIFGVQNESMLCFRQENIAMIVIGKEGSYDCFEKET